MDQNPTTLLTWACSLSDAADYNSALTDVYVQMSQTDPAGAIAAAAQYGVANHGDFMEKMAEQWVVKDAGADLGRADQLPAGAERDQIMSSLAFVES